MSDHILSASSRRSRAEQRQRPPIQRLGDVRGIAEAEEQHRRDKAKAEREKRRQKATTEEELAALEIEEFNKFRSCGIEEIKMKIMSKPEKYKDSSVFIANKEQIAKAK